jgi:signal transduction histidine kinase
VQEEERRRLARELHDEIGQTLTGLGLILKPNADFTTNAARAGFEQARALVDELLEKVRQLSFDLRPAALDQLGLLPGLLTHFERYTKQTGVLVNFKHQGVDGRFAPEMETTAYRIVQEALTNVARQASVTAVCVRVWAAADTLNIQVEDRGRGFDLEAVLATPQSGGLPGMQERVTLLGGRLTIESRPGAGTQITAELPVSRAGGKP